VTFKPSSLVASIAPSLVGVLIHESSRPGSFAAVAARHGHWAAAGDPHAAREPDAKRELPVQREEPLFLPAGVADGVGPSVHLAREACHAALSTGTS
jgi:hypothetical protein